jgi:hypothetical protein
MFELTAGELSEGANCMCPERCDWNWLKSSACYARCDVCGSGFTQEGADKLRLRAARVRAELNRRPIPDNVKALADDIVMRSRYSGAGAALVAEALWNARCEAVDEALAILHDEGWLGRSEQRIASLIEPLLSSLPVCVDRD